MIGRPAAILAGLLLLTVGCSAAQRVGGIRVISNVPDAVIYVDEEVRGPARAYERHYIRLQPGEHRIMLEHPGYFPEYVAVTVQENMAMAVSVEMRPRPD